MICTILHIHDIRAYWSRVTCYIQLSNFDLFIYFLVSLFFHLSVSVHAYVSALFLCCCVASFSLLGINLSHLIITSVQKDKETKKRCVYLVVFSVFGCIVCIWLCLPYCMYLLVLCISLCFLFLVDYALCIWLCCVYLIVLFVFGCVIGGGLRCSRPTSRCLTLLKSLLHPRLDGRSINLTWPIGFHV